MGRIVDADFDTENLVDAFFAGLDITGKKFRLLIDLLDDTGKGLTGERVDADFGFLADLDEADFGLRNVDTDIDLITLEQRGDGGVGSDEVAGADVEDLNGGGGGSENFALAETSFVVGKSGAGGGDVFGTAAMFKFFEGGLGLAIARFGGSDFFGAITALEFIEFVLRVVLEGESHLPGGFGGVALLLGDEVFLGKGIVALEIKLGANLVGGGTIQFGLGGGDVFLAIAVDTLLVFGFGLRGGGAGFGDLFGAETTFGFDGIGAGRSEGSGEFLVVESNQDLSGFDGVAFAHEDFVDTAADFRADANVAGFNGARTGEAALAVEPTHGIGGDGTHRDENQKNEDTFASHGGVLRRKVAQEQRAPLYRLRGAVRNCYAARGQTK